MFDFAFDDFQDDGFPQSGDRLQILSAEEYELLWGFPRFTQSDRDLFFTLTMPERQALEQRRSTHTKLHFLLHLGYFRARQRFFRFELPAVRDDVDYLRRRYFDNKAVADLTVSDHTRQRHVEAILGLFRYRLCAFDELFMLEAHARDAARRARIARAQGLQRLAWTIKSTHRGKAGPHESVALARLRQRLEEAEARNQLLVASHRAMLSAVGELGGTRAWLRFFAHHPLALESLDQMGALPENVLPMIRQAAADGDIR